MSEPRQLTYEEIATLADVIIDARRTLGAEAPFEVARAILKAGYERIEATIPGECPWCGASLPEPKLSG